jgi:hypothetical protein
LITVEKLQKIGIFDMGISFVYLSFEHGELKDKPKNSAWSPGKILFLIVSS